MNHFSETHIHQSWQDNATQWTSAVRKGEIGSRVQVTNEAIIQAIVTRSPKTVLDIGCGEGWLMRELAKHGISCLGIDMIPELIASAREAGGGRFQQLSYEEMTYENLQETFDLAVCNFSLLGKESVEQIFRQVPALLKENGCFIVQTLPPIAGCGDEPYVDGWRKGSWAGFNDSFVNPAPWYFRTMESWEQLFTDHGFRLPEIIEPKRPTKEVPVSIIFVGTTKIHQTM